MYHPVKTPVAIVFSLPSLAMSPQEHLQKSQIQSPCLEVIPPRFDHKNPRREALEVQEHEWTSSILG